MASLLATISLTLFLLPCAIQDWRSHHISNWFTIPAFLAAWIVALALGNLTITMAVFLGCYIAWSKRWMGAADGKLFTFVAAIAPSALGICVLLLCLTFLLLRLLRNQQAYLPATVWLWLATVLNSIIISTQIPQTELVHVWWLVALPKLFAMSLGLFNLAFLFENWASQPFLLH